MATFIMLSKLTDEGRKTLKERPQKWYQKWWGWTVVGVVAVAVAGGVAATVLAVQPQPDAPTAGSVGVVIE